MHHMIAHQDCDINCRKRRRETNLDLNVIPHDHNVPRLKQGLRSHSRQFGDIIINLPFDSRRYHWILNKLRQPILYATL
ncbi:hypothetical protein PVAP13_7KG140633 [Panicum virgatum]|uniref:Uncharacterized protein n=1 Tax=Panicum virgatum TaxID=38727 RepID=A0A8T0QEK3_PANVG|nr:hypothetical protein PVAP13_7KG140633 [Panicum virgatum]